MASEFQTLSDIGSTGGGRNPVQETRYQELLKSGAGGNPAGIESPGGTYLDTPASGGTSLSGLINPQPALDLPKLYDSLYASSGVKDSEAQLLSKTQGFNDAVSTVKDNPYLSEGNMTGRISKLQDKFTADSGALKGDIATKKADIETKLGIATKQFDINSQAAQTAFSQFQSLLGNGSLDNASPDDIANITRATGLSSSMIQSAIGQQKTKDAPKVNTQVIQVDDGTNIKAVVVNQDTGAIINSQVIGQSKPKAASASDQKTSDSQATYSNASADAKAGHTLQQLVAQYGVPGGLSVDQIYALYNANSPRGHAKETLKDVQQGNFANLKGFVSLG